MAPDVTVPGNFTALTLTPLGSPTFPFRGSDGTYHIAYDLQLTNASLAPATLERIDVVDAAGAGQGPRLVLRQAARRSGLRVRRLQPVAPPPSFPASGVAIPPQEGRSVLIDFTVDSLDAAPDVVLHHVYGTAAPVPGGTTPTPVDYLTTPFDIASGSPRVLGPPLKGTNWIALNGCCLPGFPHRTSLNTTNGGLEEQPALRDRLEAGERPGRVLQRGPEPQRELRRLRQRRHRGGRRHGDRDARRCRRERTRRAAGAGPGAPQEAHDREHRRQPHHPRPGRRSIRHVRPPHQGLVAGRSVGDKVKKGDVLASSATPATRTPRTCTSS